MYLQMRRVLKIMVAVGLSLIAVTSLFGVIVHPPVGSFIFNVTNWIQLVGSIILGMALMFMMAVAVGSATRLSEDEVPPLTKG